MYTDIFTNNSCKSSLNFLWWEKDAVIDSLIGRWYSEKG